MSEKMITRENPVIAGVDPGLATGGFVIVDTSGDRQVLAAHSITTDSKTRKEAENEAKRVAEDCGGWGDREFTAAVLRAERWVEQFERHLNEFDREIDFFAVESFVDQRSRAREEKQRLVRNRWHTPLVMGCLTCALERYGASTRNRRVLYQNAGIVIRQWSAELSQLAERANKTSDVVIAGDHLVSNDHQRKALVHALALDLRLKEARRNEQPKQTIRT